MAVAKHLSELKAQLLATLLARRYEKYRRLGRCVERVLPGSARARVAGLREGAMTALQCWKRYGSSHRF